MTLAIHIFEYVSYRNPNFNDTMTWYLTAPCCVTHRRDLHHRVIISHQLDLLK